MLFNAKNAWTKVISNVTSTRPAAGWGTSITPGAAPSWGSWTTLVTAANKTDESFGILIKVTNCATSAATSNAMIDIGIDPAGGTSFTTIIPTLLCGHAAPLTVGSKDFYFPLYIPSGATVGVRGMRTAATAFNVAVFMFCRPSRPDLIECGSVVEAFGVVAASATGTVVTAGSTSDGSWVQLGSALTRPHWWWQFGKATVDTTMSAVAYTVDLGLGNATNKRIAVENAMIISTAAEQESQYLLPWESYVTPAAVGDLLYVRTQCSGTADTALSFTAYGLS